MGSLFSTLSSIHRTVILKVYFQLLLFYLHQSFFFNYSFLYRVIWCKLVFVNCFTKHLHFLLYYLCWKSNGRQSGSTEQKGDLKTGPRSPEDTLGKSERQLLCLRGAQMFVSRFLSLGHLFTWATCCILCPWFIGWPLSVRKVKCGDFCVWLCKPLQVGDPLLGESCGFFA